jgi:cell division protein FtsB
MRLLRYILVPWTVLLVYSSFSFFLGQNGLYARRHLEAERARLSENLATLEATNKRLVGEMKRLPEDDDAFSVHARRLGFGLPGERFVRVVGLGVATGVGVPSGTALYASTPHYVSSSSLRMVSMLFGAAVLVFFLINDLYWLRQTAGAGRGPRESRHY